MSKVNSLICILFLTACAPSFNDPVYVIEGQPGATGKDGSNGNDGQNGKDGINGSDGADGQDGATGSQGPQGDIGPQGPAGQDGQPGALPIGARNIGDCVHDYMLFSDSTLIISESGYETGGNHLGLWKIDLNRDFGLVINGSTTCTPARAVKCGTNYWLFYRKVSDGLYYKFQLNVFTDNSDYQDDYGTQILAAEYGVCP